MNFIITRVKGSSHFTELTSYVIASPKIIENYKYLLGVLA